MTLELISSPSRAPHPVDEHDRPPWLAARVVTALIVGIPFLALAFGVIRVWGRGIHFRDVILAVVFYVLVGHGMTIGFHRLLAHKSFTARRPIKFILVAFGSMAYEGGPIGWVANHRRHHVFADTASDPHSPLSHGGGVQGRLKGLWHAHLGWLFTARRTSSPPRRRPAGRPRHRRHGRALPGVVCGVARPAVRARMAARRHPRCRGQLSVLGGPRPGLRPAPCDMERELAVPHVRPTTLRDEGPQQQRRGARHHQHGRVLTQRPSRLSTLCPPGLLRGQWDSSAMLIRSLGRMALLHDVHWPNALAVSNRGISIGGQRGLQHRASAGGP
jgi:stearoyl-CoA desaturase (delta-9 desaturase)